MAPLKIQASSRMQYDMFIKKIERRKKQQHGDPLVALSPKKKKRVTSLPKKTKKLIIPDQE